MPDSPVCGWVETQDGEKCMCTNYEPFVVQADPQEPDYWDPGPLPDPFIDAFHPIPGDSPSGHDPQDPCEWNCPMIFDVTIWCETNVTRGEDARCELEVDPAELLDHVYGWEFRGKGPGYDGLLAYSQQHHETHWEGPIVAPGNVRVDFRVKDEFGHTFDVYAQTEVAVVPRTGSEWAWSWGDGIEYTQGGLTFPQGDDAIGKLCHPSAGCGEPLVQAQGTGFDADPVPGNGPNNGLWWVTSVSVDLQMASALNPDYLQGGVERQTNQCSPFSQINLWDFNHLTSCGGGGSGWGAQFLDWAWDHELMHAQNINNFVQNYPHLNVPTAFEELVRNQQIQLSGRASDIIDHSDECARARGAIHNDDPEHPLPSFDIWFWGPVQGAFYRWQPSDGPWGGWHKDPPPGKCFFPVT
jgi:hypothetical protein